MRTLLWVVLALDQIFILIRAGIQLEDYNVSDFAFHEQFGHSTGQEAKLRRSLHKNLPKVVLLQAVEVCIGLVISTTLFTQLVGPWLGMLYTFVSVIVLAALIRLTLVRKVSKHIFESNLQLCLQVVELFNPLWTVTGVPKKQASYQPTSPGEFTDMLRRLPSTAVTPQQRQRLELALSAESKVAAEVMTRKKRAVTVTSSATLSPVLLSDLQKSGHGYFPVLSKSGEPEGLLTLSDLDDIQNAKQRTKVSEIMTTHLAWVEEETSLLELAQAFLEEKQYLLFVRDQEGQFSGIVSIADLMKNLAGIVED